MFFSPLIVLIFSFAAGAGRADFLQEPIAPLPTSSSADPVKAALGMRLFHDPQLSKNNKISCSSCHNLSRGGVDGKRVSSGLNDAAGDMNAPTVFNSGFNFRQFWDGRSETLEDQIEGPLQNAKEMGSTWQEVMAKIAGDEAYRALFSKAYGDGITKENIKNSIAEFERSLITPNSKFDRYLRGEGTALSEKEKTGYQRFKSYGCVACHQGMNVGGNMFQTMGVMGNYFRDRGTPITQADLGRYNVTKNDSDKHVFRVPSLRNVSKTAPYFHDGSARTLEEAVTVMAKYQLGRKLSKEEISLIVAFLRTLDGETPKQFAEMKK